MSPPNRLCFLLTSKNSSQVHIILKWRYVHRSYKLNINWPAHNIWVFIAQLVEHCSANAEAMGSNPVEALQLFFFGWICNCKNCDYNCDGRMFISFLFPQFILSSFCYILSWRKTKRLHNPLAREHFKASSSVGISLSSRWNNTFLFKIYRKYRQIVDILVLEISFGSLSARMAWIKVDLGRPSASSQFSRYRAFQGIILCRNIAQFRIK